MSDTIINEIESSWGWTGITPHEVMLENEFGNVIVKDTFGKYWRICPEDVYCKVVADTHEEYIALLKNKEFLEDWKMSAIVNDAKQTHGKLNFGYKYHLAIPGVLGGEYGGDNIKVIPFHEIIRFSGDLGKQIKNLPDGEKIRLKVVD